MYKSKNCGELRLKNISEEVLLSGWVQKIRNLGPILFLDLRDMHGITQITFYEDNAIYEKAKKLGREFVIQIVGKVEKRSSINSELTTGEIEIIPTKLTILNSSALPPFTIEDQSDGGEEIRMKYRYLDIRRNPIKENLLFRHKIAQETRNYLSNEGFIEVETPVLIKSTPEGARDFVVPSRIHKGEFYALPQSPQTFKQLLMVGGIEKYFQIVKCFRDEDLRADRQPEFTQIDCELSFVKQEEILIIFEEFISHLLEKIHQIESSSPFPRITYEEAMRLYGTDKPDLRFEMLIFDFTEFAKGKGFALFDHQEKVLGICAPASHYSRKQIDEITNWMKRPQIGALSLVWIKYINENDIKSSIDKFFTQQELFELIKKSKAKKGDLLFLISGPKKKVFKQAGELRIKLAKDLDLVDKDSFAPLWVVDFPLLEWSEELGRYQALHHPFTRPKQEDVELLESSPEKVKAEAYDLVINGYEIGGGSIRIHEAALQEKMFDLLGFSDMEIQNQFGFLIEAFKYGAPPHGGIALGLDRLVMVLAKKENIRDFIAFPKNNLAKDLMSGSPSLLSQEQLDELFLKIKQ